MLAKRLSNRGRHNDRAAASRRFGFNELKDAVDPLQLLVYPDVAHLKVDILPTQTQRFALTKS
jgi:hypothetical protein